MARWIVLFGLFVSSFFASGFSSEQVIHVFLVGPGLVGGELLNQIREGFSAGRPIEVRVVGLANSRFMLIDPQGIDLENWRERLVQTDDPMVMQTFLQKMKECALPHSVFVDCTASQAVANSYAGILQSKISIVTPNKKANSSLFSSYCVLQQLAKENDAVFLYDSNVGAGLPFIQTIKGMQRAGDSIVKLEAILSGTLSYLFNTFDGTVPFSEILRQAQQKGYTEPDPRDDLNGLDMARKFLILARESGCALEMEDVSVEQFLSADCFEARSVSDFYERLRACDKQFSDLAKQAKENGKVLRFIGTLENGRAALSLQAVNKDHPFYSLSDTDNIASIRSRRYSKNPVVIRGPGAGAQVTAASVLSNIVQAGTKH